MIEESAKVLPVFVSCAACDRSLLGSDARFRLKTEGVICQACYVHAGVHREDYLGTDCRICGYPLAELEKGNRQICLRHKDHPFVGTLPKGPPCPNPECNGWPMSQVTVSVVNKASCKRRRIYVCGLCDHVEAVVKIKCNTCGTIATEYKRIGLKDEIGRYIVLYVCIGCIREKAVPTIWVSGKRDKCVACKRYSLVDAWTVGGKPLCEECFAFAEKYTDIFGENFCLQCGKPLFLTDVGIILCLDCVGEKRLVCQDCGWSGIGIERIGKGQYKCFICRHESAIRGVVDAAPQATVTHERQAKPIGKRKRVQATQRTIWYYFG